MKTSLRFAKKVSLRRLLALCVLLAAIAGFGACIGGQGSERRERGRPGQFDSYVLALSWVPAFCAEGNGKTYRECDVRRHLGFIVHGLWPQAADGRPMEYCRRVPPVSHEIVQDMLGIMPDRELIQHEWRAHGSCSGLSPTEYFGAIRTAYSRISIPAEFRSGRQTRMAPEAVENMFERASGGAAGPSVRVACRQGELTEVRVCFSRNLDPIPCSNQVRECRAPTVFVRPIP